MLSTYYVVGSILGSGDTVVSKIIKILCPRGVYVLADECSSSELPAPLLTGLSFEIPVLSGTEPLRDMLVPLSGIFSPPVYVTLTYLSDIILKSHFCWEVFLNFPT